MRVAAPPLRSHVRRWSRAMPQYTVGHQARLDQIDGALALLPGVHVTGAGYRGAGVAGCVTQAETTARTLTSALDSRHLDQTTAGSAT
jgi:oxygen-dependent protoporphyrinogen oxidase